MTENPELRIRRKRRARVQLSHAPFDCDIILVVSLPNDSRPCLGPPQFGLRTLLWVVTACAVLLAAAHWLEMSPLLVGGLLFLAVAIFLHVVGNAIGTRLRQIGDRPDLQSKDEDSGRSGRPRPEDFAPATRLAAKQSLGWIIALATLVGMIAGGLGGGVWTAIASRGPFNPFNIGIGVIAFAMLGGLAAFGTVALVQVLGGAIWQAMHGSQGDREAGRSI